MWPPRYVAGMASTINASVQRSRCGPARSRALARRRPLCKTGEYTSLRARATPAAATANAPAAIDMQSVRRLLDVRPRMARRRPASLRRHTGRELTHAVRWTACRVKRHGISGARAPWLITVNMIVAVAHDMRPGVAIVCENRPMKSATPLTDIHLPQRALVGGGQPAL